MDDLTSIVVRVILDFVFILAGVWIIAATLTLGWDWSVMLRLAAAGWLFAFAARNW